MNNANPDPAKAAVEMLQEQFKWERAHVGDDHIVMVHTFVGGLRLLVEEVGTVREGGLVSIRGVDGAGNPYKLLQHYSQMTVCLTTEPISADAPRPYEIGFIFADDAENA